MKTIEGYDVKVFTDNIEETALGQIRQLLSIDTIISPIFNFKASK